MSTLDPNLPLPSILHPPNDLVSPRTHLSFTSNVSPQLPAHNSIVNTIDNASTKGDQNARGGAHSTFKASLQQGTHQVIYEDEDEEVDEHNQDAGRERQDEDGGEGGEEDIDSDEDVG
ncbi:hypothetical protein BDN67DRAFT_1017657 [Paxillus ammoniavirescens]|nr:hypothetical protein BDN67DRAFT_1017657 [Paxillus ammoniavirescens]